MATPPHEFVDTGDVPGPTRFILEPAPRVDPRPAPRVLLTGAPTGPGDGDLERRQRVHLDVDPAAGNEPASRHVAVPPHTHRPPEPDSILDSLPPWVVRLGDGSWPAFRSDQLWGVVALILLAVLVVLAIQRAPVFPSTLVESGTPGSEAEDPAGPEADNAGLSAAARSSERLGEPTDDEGDGVVSEPAGDKSTTSRAKTFSRGSRRMQTATTPSGDGAADDRDTIDFDPEDGSGDGDEGESIGGAPGADDDDAPTPADNDDKTPRSGPTGGAFSSSTPRRSTSLILSETNTTRATGTTTSTTHGVIITDRTTTTRALSTTTIRSSTSSSTTGSTETTRSTTTTRGSSSASSAISTTTTTAVASSTTGSTTTQSTTPDTEEPEPDPDPDPGPA